MLPIAVHNLRFLHQLIGVVKRDADAFGIAELVRL